MILENGNITEEVRVHCLVEFAQKNAAVGGALTGAIISVSDGRISQDKMVRTALTASALATAADFLKSVHLQ